MSGPTAWAGAAAAVDVTRSAAVDVALLGPLAEARVDIEEKTNP